MEEVWKDITTLTSSFSTSAYGGHRSTDAAVHHQSSVHDFLASAICPPTQRCDTNAKNVSDHIRPNQQVYNSSSFPCNHSSPTLSSIFASSVFTPQCCQKRDSEDDNGCTDRKYKRKMKNRESATRSRARRQAYINELELEVAHLRLENAMLRRRQEEMSSAAAAAAATVSQVPKKTTLFRSLTAPF